MRNDRFRAGSLYALVFIVATVLSFASLASATTITGELFYTTVHSDGNNAGKNVHSVPYTYEVGTSFDLGVSAHLAALSRADGILFGPNGNLIVANQDGVGVPNPKFTEFTTGGAFVKNVSSAVGSYHLALSSLASNALLYNAANGGCGNNCISAAQLSGGGLLNNAILYTVSCASNNNCSSTDVRGLAYDTNNKQWYYGTAPDDSSTAVGEFGTVEFDDSTHTATLHRLTDNLFFAHGIVFDPFTNSLIVVGYDTIQQLGEDGSLVSEFTGGPQSFDQASVDGKGHLFAASSSGKVQFIDYTTTGEIGDSDFEAAPLLAESLDDIAPLSGPGSLPTGVPEPSSFIMFGIGAIAISRSFFRRES